MRGLGKIVYEDLDNDRCCGSYISVTVVPGKRM